MPASGDRGTTSFANLSCVSRIPEGSTRRSEGKLQRRPGITTETQRHRENHLRIKAEGLLLSILNQKFSLPRWLCGDDDSAATRQPGAPRVTVLLVGPHRRL